MNTERNACPKITQKMCGCYSKTKVGSRGSETKEGRNKVKKSNNLPWEWNEEQTNAIQTLKTYLTTRPILKVFNPDLTTEVHTDASKDGIAGMLLQVENK
jgi:hypothetical protein